MLIVLLHKPQSSGSDFEGCAVEQWLQEIGVEEEGLLHKLQLVVEAEWQHLTQSTQMQILFSWMCLLLSGTFIHAFISFEFLLALDSKHILPKSFWLDQVENRRSPVACPQAAECTAGISNTHKCVSVGVLKLVLLHHQKAVSICPDKSW